MFEILIFRVEFPAGFKNVIKPPNAEVTLNFLDLIWV